MKSKKQIKAKIINSIATRDLFLLEDGIMCPFIFGRKKHLRKMRDDNKYSEGFIDALNWVLRNED